MIRGGDIFEVIFRLSKYYLPHWFIFLGKSDPMVFKGDRIKINRMSKNIVVRQAKLTDLEIIIGCTEDSDDRILTKLFKIFIMKAAVVILLNIRVKLSFISGYFLIFTF